MITLLSIKSLLSRLTVFILDNYRVVAFILLLALTYYYKSSYNAVVADYERYKANVATVTEIRKAENAQLAKYAKQAVEAVTLHHTEQMEVIKHDYEKRNKVNIGTIVDLRHKLRDQIATDSLRVPEAPSDTETNPEVWRERYSKLAGQYETLKYGCAITTADFNVCREWIDIACLQVGCE